jgi:hypothetical protein
MNGTGARTRTFAGLAIAPIERDRPIDRFHDFQQTDLFGGTRQLHATVDTALTAQDALSCQPGANFGQKRYRDGVPLCDGFARQSHANRLQREFKDGANGVIGLLSNFHDRQ